MLVYNVTINGVLVGKVAEAIGHPATMDRAEARKIGLYVDFQLDMAKIDEYTYQLSKV